jgi:pilus assembly protein FimV
MPGDGEEDDVSTKLDLARAYVEMGDQDGARSILEEVVSEGNEGQKDEAQKLLADIG